MKSYKTIWADVRHGQGWMCPYCVDRRGHTLATHNNAMFRLRDTSQLGRRNSDPQSLRGTR